MKCISANTDHANLEDAEKSCKQNDDCYAIYFTGASAMCNNPASGTQYWICGSPQLLQLANTGASSSDCLRLKLEFTGTQFITIEKFC